MESRYLVAHDFSSSADAALEEAIQDARRTGASLVLVHVHAPVVPPPALSEPFPIAPALAAVEGALEEQRGRLRSVVGQVHARHPGLPMEADVVTGSIAEAIVQAAK